MRRIYQAVSQILGDILGLTPDEVTPDTQAPKRFQEMAAAAIACEKTFHIELEDERIPGLRTAADWAAYVEERLSGRDESYMPPTDEDREKWR